MLARSVRRSASRHPLRWWILGPLAGALGTAGATSCADALHLDPASTTGSSSSSSGSSSSSSSSGKPADGGSDAGSTSCNSSPDCAYPTAVCDTIAHKCVECLVVSDCVGKPGTVCSLGACECAPSSVGPLTYCAGESPTCIDTASSPTNCGSCGNVCFGSCSVGACENAWSQIPTGLPNAPSARAHHVAVWTGSKMFVWGGQDGAGNALGDGGLYDPSTRSWTPVTTTNAPDPRHDATAVWDDVDKLVLVWGGASGGSPVQTGGGRYNPATDSWTAIPASPANNAPANTVGHTAVWAKPLTGVGTTTAAMIVFGGFTDTAQLNSVGTGAIYDPAANSGAGAWVQAIPDSQVPSLARGNHIATWNGSGMVIFGGLVSAGTLTDAQTYSFVPPTTWNTITPGAVGPAARYAATGVADPISSAALLFGGEGVPDDGGAASFFNDAFSLSVGTTTGWSSIGGTSSSVEPRAHHTAVAVTPSSTESQLVVFGGLNTTGYLGTGWVTGTTTSGTWAALPNPGPAARAFHTAVSTGATMIIWGGQGVSGVLGDGAIYTASP